MTEELRAACVRALHVQTAQGEMLRAGRAVLFLLGVIGYPIMSRFLSWPPMIWFVELGYVILARNRRFFARFFFRQERALPDEKAQ